MNAHHAGDSNFEIAALFPLDLSGEIVALRACIDASRLNSGVFAVAGLAFGYDNAVKGNAEWKRLMKGRTFHMTDLNARKEDFEGISDPDKHEIMVGIVEIIKRYASYTVAVSCDSHLLSEPFPNRSSPDAASIELRNGFRLPYGAMCHLAMARLGMFANDRGKREISYVLETGDEGQKGFIRYIDFMQGAPYSRTLLDMYSLARLTTTPKGEMEGLFHSADFVAWEWARHIDRQKRNDPMRKSLSVLTDNDSAELDYFGFTLGKEGDKQFLRHYDNRHIDRLAKLMRQTVEAETNDKLDDAFSQWVASR